MAGRESRVGGHRSEPPPGTDPSAGAVLGLGCSTWGVLTCQGTVVGWVPMKKKTKKKVSVKKTRSAAGWVFDFVLEGEKGGRVKDLDVDALFAVIVGWGEERGVR